MEKKKTLHFFPKESISFSHKCRLCQKPHIIGTARNKKFKMRRLKEIKNKTERPVPLPREGTYPHDFFENIIFQKKIGLG